VYYNIPYYNVFEYINLPYPVLMTTEVKIHKMFEYILKKNCLFMYLWIRVTWTHVSQTLTVSVYNYRDIVVSKWKRREFYVLYVILTILRHQKKFRDVTLHFIFINRKRICRNCKINTMSRIKIAYALLHFPSE
jgi:hypothetical protein